MNGPPTTRGRHAALILAAVGACGRLEFAALATDGATTDAATPACARWSPWAPPQHIPEVGTASDEYDVAVSPDGQYMVLGSYRANWDLMMATRQGSGWSIPVPLDDLNTGVAHEIGPAWSASGQVLYFTGGISGSDQLYMSEWNGAAFSSPTLVPGMETSDATSIWVSRSELEMLYTRLGGAKELCRAIRSAVSEPWQPLGPIAELNAGPEDGWPSMLADELTLYYESARPGNADIYVTSRPAVGAPFSPPVPVGELNTPSSEGDPELSLDGATMWLTSHRLGTDSEVFVTTRTCLD